jgi:hypothetical protein
MTETNENSVNMSEKVTKLEYELSKLKMQMSLHQTVMKLLVLMLQKYNNMNVDSETNEALMELENF